jgi:hypothetical protein
MAGHERTGLFENVIVCHFDWEVRYEADAYLRLLNTFPATSRCRRGSGIACTARSADASRSGRRAAASPLGRRAAGRPASFGITRSGVGELNEPEYGISLARSCLPALQRDTRGTEHRAPSCFVRHELWIEPHSQADNNG